MLGLLRQRCCSALPAVLLLAACATTQINSTWKDSSYQGHPARIMVIGVAKNPAHRNLFEDEFASRLRSRGTEAIASHAVRADKQENDQASIAAKAEELNVDTVLITRLVNMKTVQSYVPGTVYYPPPIYGTWPDYFGFGYRSPFSSGYITQSQYAVMETNLYETRHNRLVWSASSETLLNDSDDTLIRSFIGTMVKAMGDSGLLGR